MDMNLNLEGVTGEVFVTVLIGKLETGFNFNLNDLDHEQKDKLTAIIAEHLESLDTREVLNLLNK
jgi:hypothetical protein